MTASIKKSTCKNIEIIMADQIRSGGHPVTLTIEYSGPIDGEFHSSVLFLNRLFSNLFVLLIEKNK